MKQKAIGLGAGGHAKVVIEALRQCNECEIVGLLDPNACLVGQTVMGVPVLGGDDLMAVLAEGGVRLFFLGVGSIGEANTRKSLFGAALVHGLDPISVIHPRATVSKSAILGRGTTILACAVVNADARLGENVLVNTAAVVEHDCVIGAHSHIATGCHLAGGVTVGEGSLVGIGSAVRQGISIGRKVIVGAGAVVVTDVPDGVVVVGVPARAMRRKSP